MEVMKLDALQRLMRGFRRLAPYNAAQVVELVEPVDVSAWARGAEDVVLEEGLGRPVFSEGDRQFRFEPIPFPAVATVTEDLASYLASELDAPFRDDALPLRFFACGRHAGVVYDHWIADSRSIRALLERIHARLPEGRSAVASRDAGEADRSGRGPGAAAPPSSRPRGWTADPLGPIRILLRHRRAFRVSLADPLDFRTGVLLLDLPDGLTDSLRTGAHALGATVHDLVLTSLAQSIASIPSDIREPSRTRRSLGLGTIVDLRAPGDDALGMRLGAFTTIHSPPGIRTPDGVAETTRQSRAGKRRAAGSGSLFGAALLHGRLAPSDRDRALFFHRNAPLAAGISNVNVKESRAGIRGHLTVSPTGPFAPLVLALTTTGPRTRLCVTYRRTAFGDATAGRLAHDFVGRLSLTGVPGSPSSPSGR